LLSDNHKYSRAKNSGQYFHPSIKHHQPTIKKATKGISKPISCAESSCGIQFPIAQSVVALQPKQLSGEDFDPTDGQ
jgi:hypothetical protein